jgi:hypothetical protein
MKGQSVKLTAITGEQQLAYRAIQDGVEHVYETGRRPGL